MGVNRSRVRALQHKANGQVESFPLRDGSRYYFDRQQAALAIFMYAFEKTLREEEGAPCPGVHPCGARGGRQPSSRPADVPHRRSFQDVLRPGRFVRCR